MDLVVEKFEPVVVQPEEAMRRDVQRTNVVACINGFIQICVDFCTQLGATSEVHCVPVRVQQVSKSDSMQALIEHILAEEGLS